MLHLQAYFIKKEVRRPGSLNIGKVIFLKSWGLKALFEDFRRTSQYKSLFKANYFNVAVPKGLKAFICDVMNEANTSMS